jgi:hypothetical protein
MMDRNMRSILVLLLGLALGFFLALAYQGMTLEDAVLAARAVCPD